MKFVAHDNLRRNFSRYSFITILVGLSAGLSACQSDGGSNDSVSSQPITEPTPKPTSNPVATPTPKPTSTPKPTATPTPKPTATPAPSGALFTGPAELTKFVQKFIDDSKREGFDVSSRFGPSKLTMKIASLKSVGANTIGLCSSSGSSRVVTVDTTFWNANPDIRRETLVHHELGHCILNRGHTSAKLSTGEYASIMTPYILSQSTYVSHYSYYINELFANAPRSLMAERALASTSDSEPMDYVCDGDHEE